MHYRFELARMLFCACLLAGCSSTQVTETEWAPSQNGRWLTRISRYDTAGPGTNALYETVQLKRQTGSKAVAIFTLDEGEMTGEQLSKGPVITLVWCDSHHLEISHRGGEVVHGITQIADLFVQIRE